MRTLSGMYRTLKEGWPFYLAYAFGIGFTGFVLGGILWVFRTL